MKGNADLRDNSETGTSVMLDKVDYSPARNSCVAEVETIDFFKGGALEHESVQDLLSGETLLSLPCNKGCVDIFLKKRFIEPAFDYVMNNADEPVELGRQYVQMQSDLAHKSTTPAPSLAEPKDWQTVPATEYDAQGKPIASPQSPRTSKQGYTGKPIHAPASKHKSVAPSGRPPLDPATGEPIHFDPVTGERIQPHGSQHKSASPSGP